MISIRLAINESIYDSPNMKPSTSNTMMTVVITNYNRRDDLRRALKSVEKQDYPKMAVIVVDNSSEDDSCAMVTNEFPRVSLVALRENIGLDGYSTGFKHAKGDYLFQMDNDSIMPDAKVLTEVVKRFKDAPTNLAVIATRVEEYRHEIDFVEELRQRDKRQGPINTGGFHSGGVGFRRELLDQVGYYNRDVFLYGSELFLQMKFLAAGYQVMYYPEILMLHRSSPVARCTYGRYYEVRNRYWFLRSFAKPAQRIKFFPGMAMQDIAQMLSHGSPRIFIRAIRDGLGPLPVSLRVPLFSSRACFVAKVNELGAQYSISSLLAKMRKQIRQKKLGRLGNLRSR
jgi:GT2 family glycosyltransferase